RSSSSWASWPATCPRGAPRASTRRWRCATSDRAPGSGALAQQTLDALTLLEPEQALLAPEAAAVASELAPLFHPGGAGDHDRDPVHAVRGAHRAHGVGRAGLLRDVLVGA